MKKCTVPGCVKTYRCSGYCTNHYSMWLRWGTPYSQATAPNRRRDPLERFWEKVDKTSSPDGCWLWTGKLSIEGYGRFCAVRSDGHEQAHRYSYELAKGKIPAGLEIDHTCHTHEGDCSPDRSCPHRSCVNPDHLEPVTRRVNVLRSKNFTAYAIRKTRCVNGHEYTVENTYIKGNGTRNCVTCRADAQERNNAKRRLERASR